MQSRTHVGIARTLLPDQSKRHLHVQTIIATNTRKKTILVVGTGVMGRSWTTLFLAKGHKVIVSDPAPGAREKLDKFIQSEWPRMQRVGIVENAGPQAYEFVEDVSQAESVLKGEIDWVQEVSFNIQRADQLQALRQR
ncbi:hypothetical protein CERZMDRAFT_99392 [Cercospora zeae-maydis SCOH1-5]|uniref:3-hydroxyacyl-CoA dehydrogenase NAD binding domain-containing protein n=1 Tax=Cercospora zeae-maydis SCOH1-5 TaxID=717836 RepID=A0A6A6FAB4_9PEZI|nr:hypothetical protein CERZMDRAFT_99392 [Cercospora zeae-maydis SCOH1-5]